MIDILEGRLFLEKDILKIKHGKYNQNGTECFAIAVYLRGSDVPENAIYRTEPEMLRDLSLIEKAWKAAVQDDSPHSSILEEFQRMQARLDETERKLEEWHAYQQAEASGEKKSQGKKKPAKEKSATNSSDGRSIPIIGSKKTRSCRPTSPVRRCGGLTFTR